MREKKYGPYARQRKDGGWEMNEEGQKILLEWLKEWPDPARLLCRAYRGTFNAWMAAHWRQNRKKVRYDTINQTCLVACCKAMLTYDGETAKFSTYAANAMYFEVRRELDEMNKQSGMSKGVRIVSGNTERGSHDVSAFDAVVCPHAGPEAEVDSSESWEALLDAAISQPPPAMSAARMVKTTAGEKKAIEKQKSKIQQRWRHIFVSHFEEGVSQTKIAEELKVTRSVVTQIVERGCRKIRETMFAES